MSNGDRNEGDDARSDEALMMEVRAGHTESFSPLICKYQQPLVNFFRRLGVYTDAEDLIQETFLKVYRYRRRYRVTAKFSTFLYRVARNVWVDHCRKAARRKDLLERYEDDVPKPSDRPPTAARLDVQEAVAALPEKLRMVVVLSIYQGMKYEQIAEILGIPAGTVKSRMHLAMGRLKEHMHGD